VTSVAVGLEPRIRADSIRQVHPPSHHGPRGHGVRSAFGRPPLSPRRSSITRRGRLERPRPTAHRLDRYRGTCVNGPPTALAAVVPFGPVGTSACGPSMGRRTG